MEATPVKTASTFYLNAQRKTDPQAAKIMRDANALCRLRSKRLACQSVAGAIREVLTTYLPIALAAERKEHAG